MRARITKRLKDWVTVSQMPTVKRMVDEVKEDEYSATDYAKMVARTVFGDNEAMIFNAVAEVAGNERANDNFFEGSGTFDIWIEFIAFHSFKGACEIGVYLTDIWSYSGDAEKEEEYKSHMYMNGFEKQAGTYFKERAW